MNSLKHARRFLADQRGTGTTFLLAMLPATFALAGLAIDGASVYREHDRLQATADAAALAGAADLPDQGKAIAAAKSYAEKNMPAASDGNVLANTDIVIGHWDKDGRTFAAGGDTVNAIRVTARRAAQNGNAYPTTFLGLVGIKAWDVSAQATATGKGNVKAWVAMVLDNTGSMCQSDSHPSANSPCNPPASNTKIALLKTAIVGSNDAQGNHNDGLLDILQKASDNPGDVKAAIIPFVKDVNIGKGFVNQWWLDWTTWETQNGKCSRGSNGSTQSDCTTAYCSRSQYTNKTDCQNHGNTWNAAGTWTPADHSTWNGCVMDRGLSSGPSTNYDVVNSPPVAGNTSSLFPTEQYSYCPKDLMELSDNWAALAGEANDMVAAGATNQTIGLEWGWHALSNSNPLNSGVLPKDTARYIILLSDGLNTQNRWDGNGSSQSTDVDDRMELACQHAKDDGIIIYTVFVDVGGTQGNSEVLKKCASPGKDRDLKTAAGIVPALREIGQEITHLRLVE